MAPRHHATDTVPALTARTTIITGPMVAIAAGSSLHAGLKSRKTTSAAALAAPCMAARLAARRRSASSAAGGAPHAAP
eukprot:5389113-Lingulodinium_polyedra.AAC.1